MHFPSPSRPRTALRRAGGAASALVVAGLLGATPALAADTTPPTVAMKAPLNGGTVSGSYFDNVACSATASDAVGVGRVEFLVDGKLTNTERSAPYTCTWDTRTVANGTHVLTARAFDAAGNSASASVDVNVANAASAPTATWKAPTGGTTVSGNLNGGTACEATPTTPTGSTVKTVQFFVDGKLLNTELNAPYTCYFDTKTVPDGAHELKAIVTDSAGRTGSSAISVTVANGTTAPAPTPTPTPTHTPTGDPVIAAAGDIACDPASSSYNGGSGTSTSCRQKATSNLLTTGNLAKVLTLGDNQYEGGALSAFRQSYDPSWGRVKSITAPAVGNHEYRASGASGYFDYFNGVGVSSGRAGSRGKGYYSYDIGSWHVIALNSNCSFVSCAAGSAQEQWLKADLAANPRACTLAYWHHPRFSSGSHGNDTAVAPLWNALYAAGADVVLNSHDHSYERFAPQSPSGAADPVRGIREFVVGTGGKGHYGFSSTKANSEKRMTGTFGVLEVTLHPNSYDWKFRPEAGKTATDSGTTGCHA